MSIIEVMSICFEKTIEQYFSLGNKGKTQQTNSTQRSQTNSRQLSQTNSPQRSQTNSTQRSQTNSRNLPKSEKLSKSRDKIRDLTQRSQKNSRQKLLNKHRNIGGKLLKKRKTMKKH